MILILETVGLCLAFWGICWLGTGTDEKNFRGIAAYPEEIQAKMLADPRFAGCPRPASGGGRFLANLVMFSVVLLPLGYVAGGMGFMRHFVCVLWLGQSFNLFDFLVIDLVWWRHSRRVRFTGTKEASELYRNPEKHWHSFLRAVPLFFITALVDGVILALLD